MNGRLGDTQGGVDDMVDKSDVTPEPVSEAARREIVRESFSPITPDAIRERVLAAIFTALNSDDE
ncbi:MAG TPA: hypothetical protein VFW00_06060 [Rhodocyclaceae bacterium]|nr:hypothetical protein [Rhodocyclaceae bacterium]